MTLAAREPCDNGRADQALRIDDAVERRYAEPFAETPDLAPCPTRKKMRAPAARRNLDHLVSQWMKPHQRRETLLDHPGKPRLRKMPLCIRQRRHVMDDVAERRCLDEENLAHCEMESGIPARIR